MIELVLLVLILLILPLLLFGFVCFLLLPFSLPVFFAVSVFTGVLFAVKKTVPHKLKITCAVLCMLVLAGFFDGCIYYVIFEAGLLELIPFYTTLVFFAASAGSVVLALKRSPVFYALLLLIMPVYACIAHNFLVGA